MCCILVLDPQRKKVYIPSRSRTAPASSALAHSKCLYLKSDRFLWHVEISSAFPILFLLLVSHAFLLPAAIIVDEADIGRYTVKAALDPRTANKVVRLEPPRNVLTQNELVALAEKVWGKTIKKKHVSAEALVEAYNSEFRFRESVLSEASSALLVRMSKLSA
jgi:hypothetical protein